MEVADDTRVVGLVSRAGCAVVLGATWAIGYFTIGGRTHPTPCFDPSTPVDTWIPFVGWAVWPYLLGIAGIVLPVGVIRLSSLFIRTAVGYAFVITASFLSFVLLPTNAAGLRQHASTVGLDPLTAWVIGLVYAIDPPTNLLPSLHVSLATLAVLAISSAYPALRPWAYASWLTLAASVCAVKQHSVVDALSGALLARAAFELAGLCTRIRRLSRPGTRATELKRGRAAHAVLRQIFGQAR